MNIYHDFYHDAQHDPGVLGHDPGAYNIHLGTHYGVDGGGLGHGGHHHGDHFNATSYADAFSGHHHHHGGIIAQLLGLNQGHHHHGLLARLLGLDSKHHYAHRTPPELTQQGQFLWENLGRVFKHDLFNEFDLTPGKLFFLLLAGMIGWLFVLSFTRRHESQVNALLGANVAQVAAYEGSNRLNQPNQKPIELPSNSLYSFYLSPNKFTLSRMIAKQSTTFVASPSQGSPIVSTPTAALSGVGVVTSNETNGTSSVKTADGRIQTIVTR
jgi:hypothetical protein